MRKLLLVAFATIPFLQSCYYDNFDEIHPVPNTTACDTTAVSFATDILPIFNGSCGSGSSSCHLNSASAGTYGLANYADVDASLTAVANDYSPTAFMDCIQHNAGVSPMPKGGGKLDDCSINKIKAWLDHGHPNN